MRKGGTCADEQGFAVTSRRNALGAFGALLASIPLAGAQTASRLPRIGIVHPASVEDSLVYKALLPGLVSRGYVNGRDILLELRSAFGKAEALPALTADLVRAGVDLLLVVGPAATTVAVSATKSVPIIAIDLESDPVQTHQPKTPSHIREKLSGYNIFCAALEKFVG